MQGLPTVDPTVQPQGITESAICSPDVARIGTRKEHETCSGLDRLSSTPDRSIQSELLFVLLRHGWRAIIDVRMGGLRSRGAQKLEYETHIKGVQIGPGETP